MYAGSSVQLFKLCTRPAYNVWIIVRGLRTILKSLYAACVQLFIHSRVHFCCVHFCCVHFWCVHFHWVKWVCPSTLLSLVYMGMRDTACTTVLFGRGLISGMLCDHDIVVFKALRHLLCVGLLCMGCEWSQRGSFWCKTVFEKMF